MAPIPPGVSLALAAFAEVIPYTGNHRDVPRMVEQTSPDLLVCPAALAESTDPVPFVERMVRYLPVAVVGPRDWPHVQAVISHGAAAYVSTDTVGPRSAGLGLVALLERERRSAESPATVGADGPPLAGLSPRELEALGYIASGYTHGQTATRMGVSKTTVDTFVARIRTKLGVGNKADLTRAALSKPIAVGTEPRSTDE